MRSDAMKRAYYRTWVLLLGIAVAIVIFAAILFGHAGSTSLSMTLDLRGQKPGSSHYVMIRKVLEKIDLKSFFLK
jgi:hypothetical protein